MGARTIRKTPPFRSPDCGLSALFCRARHLPIRGRLLIGLRLKLGIFALTKSLTEERLSNVPEHRRRPVRSLVEFSCHLRAARCSEASGHKPSECVGRVRAQHAAASAAHECAAPEESRTAAAVVLSRAVPPRALPPSTRFRRRAFATLHCDDWVDTATAGAVIETVLSRCRDAGCHVVRFASFGFDFTVMSDVMDLPTGILGSGLHHWINRWRRCFLS